MFLTTVERRLLRVSDSREYDRTAGRVQGRQAAAHGSLGLSADERPAQLRGAAGQDQPVRRAAGAGRVL